MPNQYTKALEEGKDKPKGANQFTKGSMKEHDQATKDKIRAEVAAQHLEKVVRAKKGDPSLKVAAAKALLPYGKSTFASVQETISEMPVDEQETLARLTHLFSQNPALLKPLIEADPGLRAALKAMIEGKPAEVEQVTHSATG